MFLSDTAKRQPDQGNLTWLRNCGVVFDVWHFCEFVLP
jgi:hypothetical protein